MTRPDRMQRIRHGAAGLPRAMPYHHAVHYQAKREDPRQLATALPVIHSPGTFERWRAHGIPLPVLVRARRRGQANGSR